MRSIIPAIVLIPLLSSVAGAQQTSEATFKSYSQLVQISVLAKRNGTHVRDLKKEDFSVLENGKKVEIATFEEVSGNSGALHPPRSLQYPNRGEYSTRNDVASAISVILIDAINTRVLDQTYARQHVIKFLRGSHLPEGQPIGLMVGTQGGLKVIHHFTTDVSVLEAALEATKGEARFPSAATDPASFGAEEIRALQEFTDSVDAPAFQCEMAARDTVRVLRELAYALRGFPGRKTVLWATSGFNFSCGPVTLRELAARAFEELADANVSIYPVDARGLQAYDFLSADPAKQMRGSQVRNPVAFNLQRYSGWFTGFRNSVESLLYIAEMTGGSAFYNTNDISAALSKAAADANEYYLLGYYAKGGTTPESKWRSLEVKSRIRGLNLRHRRGIYVTPGEESDRATDVDLARESPLDFSGLAFKVRWPSGAPANAAEFEIEIDSKELTLSSDGRVSIDLLVVERSDDGKTVTRKSHTISGRIKDAAEFQARPLRFTGKLDDEPISRNLRFIVRDNLSHRMGSITVKTPASQATFPRLR